MMTAADPLYLLSEYRSFSGVPEECREARLWTRALLREFSDVVDAAEVVASEFFSNAILHTASGRPGGQVFVSLVGLASGVIHLETVDQGQAVTRAEPMEPDAARPGGCGLYLTAALSQSWGRVPADGDPRYGVFAIAPDGYTGPMVTWADFCTGFRP